MWGETGDTQWSEGAHDLGCEYKKWGKMGCFENLIIVFDYVFYDILNGIGEWVFFIYGRRHG